MQEYERAPQPNSSNLQLFFYEAQENPLTAQLRVMPEDGISLLPSLSLGDSKKEEAKGHL